MGLTTDGKVYTWGKGYMGNLGHGEDDSDRDEHFPKLVEVIQDKNIIAGASGTTHILLIDDAGRVYSCGGGLNGCLGHGDSKNKFVPTLISLLETKTIVQVGGGEAHSVFLTVDGEVHTCGQNRFGQLGVNFPKTKNSPKPIKVVFPNDMKVSLMSSGRFSVFCLASDNNVYCWGANDTGQLGCGDCVDKFQPTLVKLPYEQMTSHNIHVKSISTKGNHTFFLMSDGSVYGCGLSCLIGAGETGNTVVPELVPIPQKVVKISAGHYHSVAVCDDGSIWSWGEEVKGCLGNGKGETTNPTNERPTMTNFLFKPTPIEFNPAKIRESDTLSLSSVVKSLTSGSSFSVICI
eukprot:TRINITY_DN3257_c0_g2_i1.p1 TRINITY_DN3257_c0_g2~~TRINITY_DN3257_c0_g2_i1.p1  ORF type:complete len:396 (+),score=38.09 TRINITY_DN3257_c0_g2_i1:147-1190(+)